MVHRRHSGPDRDAIDLIQNDHMLLRQVCADLDQIAGLSAAEAAQLALSPRGYLREEYLAQHADEEDGLFPLLRQRCLPEDRIGRMLDQLAQDHRAGKDRFHAVMAVLGQLIAEDRGPDTPEATVLTEFAASERRHLIVENAIVLPIARARLTRADRAALRKKMLVRRGLDRLERARDAQ
jgi:hypothetical protein